MYGENATTSIRHLGRIIVVQPTLAEFCKGVQIPLQHGKDDSLYIYSKHVPVQLRWTLFHLADYAVSSVSGELYWLWPR